MGEAVLVFPAGTPDGLAFRDRARRQGLRVVGASSLDHDPAEGGYEAWEHLPYVDAPEFDAAFAAVVKKHDVTAVHAPHFIVWKHLTERLGQIAPGATLTGGQRPQDNAQAYRDLTARLATLKTPAFWTTFAGKPPLSRTERAGLVRLIHSIPGMCGEEKMLAVIEAMRHAPEGDVVEVGSWWGRSAALLVWLARRFEVGRVLCVDPWTSADLVHGEARVDAAGEEFDMDEAVRIFEINLAPLAGRELNYLRARSAAAAQAYAPGLKVRSDAFGETAYEGRIAFLHIDGDHSEPEAARDCALWTPHVAPGGWICFGDYDWAFGDGPRLVADRIVAENAARISTHFHAGPSLFVQLKR
jgi:hypothetical protein